MSRIFWHFLIILFINGQTNAIIDLSNTSAIIQWSNLLFNKTLYYSTIFNSKELDQVENDLNRITSELKTFSHNIDTELHSILVTLFTDTRVNFTTVQPLRSDLADDIYTVNEIYNRSIDHIIRDKDLNITKVKNYVETILSSSSNIPHTLGKIHDAITNLKLHEGYLQILLHDSLNNLSKDCDQYISAQQNLYYTYISVILAEMKGYIVLNQVFLLKTLSDKKHYNYINELTLANERFQLRLTDYKNIIPKFMEKFPREIHCCDVDPPKYGINFIELNRFSRAKIWSEVQLVLALEGKQGYDPTYSTGYCYTDCINVIGNNPRALFNDVLMDCQYLGGRLHVCRAPPNSPRDYIWWKNSSVTYGHDENCSYVSDMSGSSQWNIPNCDMCVCTAYTSNTSNVGIKLISVKPQLSDINNNMIVTGVQFVLYDSALYLQIQENKFMPGGLFNTSSSWKNLYENNEKARINESYGMFTFDNRALYLDDIIVPHGYVLTGIQFESVKNPNGFQLKLHATPFNFNTGKLNIDNSKWIKAGSKQSLRPNDYNRKRIEIDTGRSDDPTRAVGFNYDAKSNKFIKFTHTSINEDAGQTTVPYIEALPAISRPAFPLAGIGLFFKGKDKFGGYITPRIYTIDVSQYI